jgi:hypothetical protein
VAGPFQLAAVDPAGGLRASGQQLMGGTFAEVSEDFHGPAHDGASPRVDWMH